MPGVPSEPECAEEDVYPEPTEKAPERENEKNWKLDLVSNAYPEKSSLNIRRSITPVGSDCFRVNFRSLGNGYVIETAFVEVTPGGEIVVEDYRKEK